MGIKRVLTDEERKEREKESCKKWREKQKAENAEEFRRKNRERQARWRAANPEKAKRNTMMSIYRRVLREMQQADDTEESIK